jgi:hypothetical protein
MELAWPKRRDFSAGNLRSTSLTQLLVYQYFLTQGAVAVCDTSRQGIYNAGTYSSSLYSQPFRTFATMVQHKFSTFVRDQLWKVDPVVRVDLTGKTVVIVGANVGLGFEAAKHFASMNPKRLVLACRSQEKGQAAVQGKSGQMGLLRNFNSPSLGLAVQKATGFKNAELALVDLSKFASVSAFADAFIRDGVSQIDILVYNAGVMGQSYGSTGDGWEET